MRGKLCAALLTLAASGTVQPVAGQNASDRLAAARVQLHAMRFDSAVMLLRGVLDGSDHALPEDQAEALMLLGVIAFYQGNDSGAAGAFRHAIALDPLLTSKGLAPYDSALVVLFEAQRGVAVQATSPPGTRTREVVDCTRTCPEGVVMPYLIDVDALTALGLERFDVEHHRYGAMTVELMVDPAGHVALGSVRLVASNLQMKPLEVALLVALERALFTLPRGPQGEQVSVLVRGRIGFRNERFEVEVPVVPRRRPR
jgi:hypothetical protein